MAKIKYMGGADVVTLAKGEKFGGRLADGLPKEVTFDADNSHLIDTDEVGLPEEAVTLLLEDNRFKDVSDLKRIPTNTNEQVFRGMSASVEPTEAPDGSAPTGAAATGGGGGGGTAGTSTSGTATPTGGSTRGGSR